MYVCVCVFYIRISEMLIYAAVVHIVNRARYKLASTKKYPFSFVLSRRQNKSLFLSAPLKSVTKTLGTKPGATLAFGIKNS